MGTAPTEPEHPMTDATVPPVWALHLPVDPDRAADTLAAVLADSRTTGETYNAGDSWYAWGEPRDGAPAHLVVHYLAAGDDAAVLAVGNDLAALAGAAEHDVTDTTVWEDGPDRREGADNFRPTVFGGVRP